MNKVTIELCSEQIDQIIIDDLKLSYHLNSLPNKVDCSNDVIEPDTEFLHCIEKVLDYYMSREDFVAWKLSLVGLHYEH